MLKSTYVHLPGVGEHTERRIWDAGIRSWMEFVNARSVGSLASARVATLRSGVVDSIQKYEQRDWRFFDQALSARHKWRAFGDFSEQALYLDIETDGGFGPDAVTVIGLYDGVNARCFVRGVDLEAAARVIEKHPLVVTYNGASFDMPLIRALFPRAVLNHVHVDLLHPLRRLGYTGGLKNVERLAGLRRSEDTTGLDGWDAVRLWREYEFGSQEALALLLDYNREDIVNLKPLMEMAFRELSNSAPK